MRKSATGPRSPSKIDELLADVGQLEAFIIAAEERLELVADELCRRQRLSVVLDPRVEIGTWETADEIALGASRRPITPADFELRRQLLEGFVDDPAA